MVGLFFQNFIKIFEKIKIKTLGNKVIKDSLLPKTFNHGFISFFNSFVFMIEGHV